MPEEKKELTVPVPLSLLRKVARTNRPIKVLIDKYLSANNLPGSQKTFEVSFDHNKAYELEEKKKAAEKLEAEIKKSEKTIPEQLAEAKKNNSDEVKKANDVINKKRS